MEVFGLKTIKSDLLSCLSGFINDPAHNVESLGEQLLLCAISSGFYPFQKFN